MLVKVAGRHSSGGETIGEIGPTTESKPVTYTLSQSFSHMSYGNGHSPSSPITYYVPNTGMSPTVIA